MSARWAATGPGACTAVPCRPIMARLACPTASFSVHPDRAGQVAGYRVRDCPVQAEGQRALAAAARPEHEEGLAAPDGERDVAECRPLPPDVLEPEPLDDNHPAAVASRMHGAAPYVVRLPWLSDLLPP